jgi:Type IV secretion-system coupling protein DNA-binding domain
MTDLSEALHEDIISFCRDHNDGRFPPAAIFIAIDGLTNDLPYDRRIEKSLLESFVKLILHLPDSFMCSLEELTAQVDARGFHGPGVPLHDALDNCGQAICDFALPILYDEELTENGLLADWRRQLFQNEAHMNGLTMYGRRSKAVPAPQERDEPPDELCYLYFQDTPLLDLFKTQISFRIPDEVRPEHILMIASTGSGKTQFIQQDILAQLSRPDPPGMVVIDSQNQMIPKLERLRIARDRIIIVDPFDEQPPALNMFIAPKRSYDANLIEAIENETLQQFAWIFSALDQELTGRMTTLFTFAARILLAMAPHSNMMTLLELLRIEKPQQLKASQFWPYIERSDDQNRYFFDERFCTTDYNKTKAGVADRLLGVMRVPAFNRMFMATDNRLDLYRELADRKLIVFNTQKRKLGPDASAVLGRYAIALYIRSAFEREADRAPPPAFLYIDEASEYFGKRDSSDTLFTQLRKYNCGTFVAFQDVSQLQQQTGTLIANTTTKLAARISPADASVLASAMRTSAEHLLSITKQPQKFQMACYIKDIMSHGMTMTFPYGAVEYAEQLTPEEHRALRANNRRRLGVLESVPKVTHITSVAEGADNTRRAHEAKPFAGMYLPQMHEAGSGPAEPSNANVASEPLIKPGKRWD